MKLKAIIAAVILLSLLCIIASSSAASSYTITASVTNGTGLSAVEWYSSAQSRALLTISLSIDTIPNISDTDADSYTSFWLNPSWVGISTNKRQVMVSGYYSNSSSTTVLIMVYTPGTGKIEYIPMVMRPAISDDLAETLCLSAFSSNTSSYERNSTSEIVTVLTELLE